MSIEAMKQVIELYDKHCYNNDYGGIEFNKRYGYKFIEAIEALRAAIQQAEAQQPAKGEPVDFPAGAIVNGRTLMDRIEAYPFESEGGDLRMCSDWHELRRCFEYLADYVSPRPAPSVPDDDFDLICNAIDKADTITMEGDYMLDSDDCIAVVRVMQVLLSVRAAMLAAK